MLDIIEKFNEQEREYDAKRKSLDEKMEEAERCIARLEKRRDNLPRVSWVKGIVEPIAIELATRTGLSWELYGPFGITCETSIYLREDMSRSICEQTTRSITLLPPHGDLIYYQTGETSEQYPKGSLGEMNGMNRKTAVLPETIEEIEKLLETIIYEEEKVNE